MSSTSTRKTSKERAEEKRIIALINKRRRQCLIHRYLYYVKSEPLIDDYKYDMLERELRSLVEAHPALSHIAPFDSMCPARIVGSSNREDYPRAIEQLAESLLSYARKNTGNA